MSLCNLYTFSIIAISINSIVFSITLYQKYIHIYIKYLKLKYLCAICDRALPLSTNSSKKAICFGKNRISQPKKNYARGYFDRESR